jgi:hypothetical protein
MAMVLSLLKFAAKKVLFRSRLWLKYIVDWSAFEKKKYHFPLFLVE